MRVGYDDVTDFAQKVVDSSGRGVKFDRRRTDLLYEWQDLDKSFALWCNPILHDISLINIKDKDGNAVFQKKFIELTYRSFEGLECGINLFERMSVYLSSSFIKFDDKEINVNGMFDKANIRSSKSPFMIQGGDLNAARMFTNSTGVEECCLGILVFWILMESRKIPRLKCSHLRIVTWLVITRISKLR